MFFIFSKTIDFLLSPLVWILIVLIAGFRAKKSINRKVYLSMASTMLIFFSNSFISGIAFRAWEGEPIPLESLSVYQTGIVLTGVAMTKKNAPDRVFFAKGADRVMHTVELYKAGKIKNILISGGSGAILNKEIPEAQKLKKAFLYSGVPDSVIFLEDRSRNTVESARYSKRICDSLQLGSKYLLITSAFHMPRSMGCFRKAGINTEPYSVDYYTSDPGFTPGEMLIPSEYALYRWGVLIHELAGYVIYKLMGYI